MNRIKKKFFLIAYYGLFCHLPDSKYPLGNIFNFLRVRTLNQLGSIGSNTKIQSNVYIGDGTKIVIGKECQINENVKMDNIIIGDFVMVARNCTFLSKIHNHDDINVPMIKQGSSFFKKTVIEKDVWIGLNCTIMPGIIIRQGSIIGAGAVLTKDTEPYGIYGGIPAVLIKKRNGVLDDD